MATYRIVAGKSRLTMEATSSVHPINGEASGLSGVIEADVVDGQISFGTPPVLRLAVRVDSVKTGNPLYDGELVKRLDARRFPTVNAQATAIAPAGADGRHAAKGEITLLGATRKAERPLTITAPDERTLVIEGEHTLDMRDYGLNPPRVLLLKVDPEVKIRARLVAERDDA